MGTKKYLRFLKRVIGFALLSVMVLAGALMEGTEAAAAQTGYHEEIRYHDGHELTNAFTGWTEYNNPWYPCNNGSLGNTSPGYRDQYTRRTYTATCNGQTHTAYICQISWDPHHGAGGYYDSATATYAQQLYIYDAAGNMTEQVLGTENSWSPFRNYTWTDWCPGYKVEVPNTYRIVYNANGGSGSMAEQEMTYDTWVSLSGNLYGRSGYEFIGWNTASNGSGSSYNNQESVGNLTAADGGRITLYAQWRPKEYQVSFNGNGGTPGKTSQPVTYQSVFGTLPGAVRTGHTFLGWYTQASGGSRVDVSTIYDTAGDCTLYAHWRINNYNVTYDANGGDSVEKSKASVTFDKPVDLGVTAQKKGYVFVGWNIDPSAKEGLPSYQMPAKDVTLYAVYSIPVSDVKEVYVTAWEPGKPEDSRSYPLTQTGAGADTGYRGYYYSLESTEIGNDFEMAPAWALIAWDWAGNYQILKQTEAPVIPERYLQTVEHNRYDVLLQDYVRFDTTSEWSLGGETYTPQYLSPPDGYQEEKIDGSYIVQEDTVSKAYYIPLSYRLFFDPNGGTCSMESKEILYGDVYGELPSAYRIGHTFQGWFTEPELGERKIGSHRYETPGDSTLYAHWKVNSHTIYYDYETNGGTSGEREMETVAYGTAVDMSVSAEKEGWEHVGWNTDPEATEPLYECTMPDEDLILYAIYRKEVTATFFDCSDTGTVTRNETVVLHNRMDFGTLILPEQNIWTGWQALGWCLEPEGDAAVAGAVGAMYELSDNVTFYGKYTRLVTVSYDANGSLDEFPEETKQRYYNASGEYWNPVFVLAPEPALPSNSFVGWEDQDGNLYEAESELPLEEDTVFTARWDEYPEIEAYDKYFTLEQAVGGSVTQEALLVDVKGIDREDGALTNGSDVVVIRYRPEDFTDFTVEGGVSVTYQATDSFGNTVTKTVMAYLVDTALHENDTEEYVRFISQEFYQNEDGFVAQEQGGLAENSIWKINESYAAALQYALNNRRQGVETGEIVFAGHQYPITQSGTGSWGHRMESWSFDAEQVQQVKEYVMQHGLGNYRDGKALEEFYKFLEDF